jgi:phage baseplate assembly protein gpV
MSAPLNNNDWSMSFSDGTRFRYNRVLGIFYLALRDCGIFVYNASVSLFRWFMPDGAISSYDAIGHHYLMQLPNGADFTVKLNGTTLYIDPSGNASITTTGSNASITLCSANDIIIEAANQVLVKGAMVEAKTTTGNLTLQSAADIPVQTNTYNYSVNNQYGTYNQHTHGGVQTGSGNSQPPNQQWP